MTWYAGEDSADARATIASRVDESSTVGYGVQANESGLVQLVRSLAVVAVQGFSTSDASASARFDALASRNRSRLAGSHDSEQGSIAMIAVELGNTQAAVSNTAGRHTTHAAQLDGLLGDLETVPKEDVAMEILALQTRLQASYQATALIGQMSLANYLR
jgi:hypothetical protein